MGFEKVWNARLQQARKTSLKGKKILCAFNALVDLQEFVSCRQVENLLEKRADVGVILKRSKRVVTAVDSQADFLAALLHSMREGKALHITSGNPEVFTWLQLAFGPVDETRLGGQAGIIANQAALLGARSIVYSPIFSKELSKFFVKGVMFPVVERGKFFLVDAKKAGRDGDETKKNWIFEFSGGDTFSFGKYSFKIPRSNRFILASKMPVVPAFEASLRPALPIIGAKVGSIVFAGFHYLKPYYDKFSFEAVLQRQDADVRSLCKKNKDLVVHVEYVPMPYPEIAKGVLAHVAREAKSFGVNEVEVKEVLGFLGFERLARQIEENESAAAIYAGALVLLDALALQRIHVHNLGYSVLVLKKPLSKKAVEKARNALLYASLCTGAKAIVGGEFEKKSLSKTAKLNISSTGFAQLKEFARVLKNALPFFDSEAFLESGVFESDASVALVVPTPVVKRPKSTVGLGDVVSSTALLAQF